MNERGFTISKGKSRDHIDAAVAMCLAVHASLSGEQAAAVARPGFVLLSDYLDPDDDN